MAIVTYQEGMGAIPSWISGPAKSFGTDFAKSVGKSALRGGAAFIGGKLTSKKKPAMSIEAGGDLGGEKPWYKKPAVLFAGVGALIGLVWLGGRSQMKS